MGKQNRAKRAAKKRNRHQRGPTPPRNRFENLHGPGCTCGFEDDFGFDDPGHAPPPPSPEQVAEVLRVAAHDHAARDDTAARTAATVLGDPALASQQRTAATAAGIVLGQMIGNAWRAGWLPVDVWEYVRREFDDAVASLLVDTIAADVAKYAAATVHDRWMAQVRQLDASVWWQQDRPHLEQWAQRHGLTMVQALLATIRLLSALMMLPVLPEIVPPPGAATRAGRLSDAGVNPKVLARVRGLLAKAESTQFPEEAEALSAKAQELMNRYAFERALLDADAHKQQRAGSARLWLDAPYVDAKSSLVGAIAKANRCRSVFYSNLGFVALVGEEMDLEITELLATSLLVQATRAMVAEGSHTTFAGTSRTRSFRRSFLLAYAARIGERLTEASSRAHDPVEDARLLPVLAARSRVVDETFDAMFSHTVQMSRSVTNGAGWSAGRAAADRADLDIERRTISA